MPDTPSERIPFTTHRLCNALDDFISDNSGSGDVNVRWLTNHLAAVRDTCRRVRSDNLDETEKKAAAAFRLDEIARAKASRQREIDILDQEARKLHAAQ